MNSAAKQKGFTLLEVLVASAVLAVISVMTYSALDAATRASEVGEEAIERIQKLDRVWIVIENDLRNTLVFMRTSADGDLLPAMKVEYGQEYVMSFIRGGRSNPLNLPRTELSRVGYRLEEDAIWRDSWIDPANMDEDLAQSQILIDGVEDIVVKVLPKGAKTPKSGWLESWPTQQEPHALPEAVEVTVTLENRGELKRLFALAPGM